MEVAKRLLLDQIAELDMDREKSRGQKVTGSGHI
jgi:hypothetical protein